MAYHEHGLLHSKEWTAMVKKFIQEEIYPVQEFAERYKASVINK